MTYPIQLSKKKRKKKKQKSFDEIDKELREKEIQRYRENPDMKMPIMIPVRELGGVVHWPTKFR